MFGDLFNIKEKLEQAKREVEETKERLNHVFIDKTSPCGMIKVSVTGNKQIHSIEINPGFGESNEKMAEVLKSVLNEALHEAGKMQETELKNAFMKHMPSIPGLDKLF